MIYLKKILKLVIKILLVFSIFILGYICGKIGIDVILYTLILRLSNLDLIQIIGFSSSIATLILFFAYICGKYFIIKQMKKTIFENVVRCGNEPNNLEIVAQYNIGDNNSEQIFLYSSDTLNWIKIYDCTYDSKNNRFNKGNLLESHGFLRKGFAIQINTYLPCGTPKYLIEYQRYDFIIGNLALSENGNNGIVDEGISTTHTFKSILYYLVK